MEGKSYYGLDKLCLNNVIQDNTYLKDYLTYQLMGAFGVNAPLCSFAYLTVNGEEWGLYVAVEGVEDAFLTRNYGADAGELYKPDSTDMGGGRGNGRGFDMEQFQDQESSASRQEGEANLEGRVPPGGEIEDGGFPSWEEGAAPPDMGEMPEGGEAPSAPQAPEGPGGGMGSSDVKLQYIDDDPESYPNLFESAKTDTTQADEERLIQSLRQLGEGTDLEKVLDMDQVLRYFVVHNYVVNGDSYTGSMVHNYYLYEEDGKLAMIPWDYNLAFGGFEGGDTAAAVNDPLDTPLSVTGDGDRPMADWIFSNEGYTQLYHQYFQEFLDTVDIQGILNEAAALIAPYVEKDPTKFCTYAEFEDAVAALKEFCALRTQSLQGQLDGTIPSTDQGQQEDPQALVDTAGLTLSDMGSMNVGGMGGFGQRGEAGDGGQMTLGRGRLEGLSQSDLQTRIEQSGEETAPSGQESGEETAPFDREAWTPPEGVSLESGTSAGSWTLLGAAAALLAAGIALAARYRRRI